MIVTIIYVLAAVIPAIFLMWHIYKYDKIEKEPNSLLVKLIFGGVLAGLLAMVLEYAFGQVLDNMYFHSYNAYMVATATMVGLSEEFAKMFFLKRFSWKKPDFNYRYDGIVYAVYVSLGFAAFENIL